MKHLRLLIALAWLPLAGFPARAQYPLRESFFPAAQQPGGAHGFSAAASATYVVVGAPLTDIAGVANAGVATVYDASTGALVATLPHPSPATGDQFGYAVAVSGSRVAVGARFKDAPAADSGVVYLYDLASATPTAPVTVSDPTPSTNGFFGGALALSGDRLAVGAFNPGSVYVFDLSTPAPTLVATLSGNIGSAVGISGTRVLAGSPASSPGGTPGSGSALLFDLSSGTPTVPVWTLNNPNPALNDAFGSGVAISGNLVVIGTPADNTTSFIDDAGSAYVYDFTGATPGTPPAFLLNLLNPTPATGDRFGSAVAVSGGQVLIGTASDNTGASDAGAAYLYDLSGAAPATPAATVNNPSPAGSDLFGSAVALAGVRAAIGASGDDAGGADTGSVFLYDVTAPTQPVFSTTLAPAVNPNPETGMYFGGAVAVAGNLMVVGAIFADAPGALNSGAAYVYDLGSATPRVPIAVLANPSPGADDEFGVSVAVYGKRVVVGAWADDTAGGFNSGRAYVYDMSSGTPATPVRILENPAGANGDFFGTSVAIWGDLVVVGAARDDVPGSAAADAGRVFVFDLGSATPGVPRASVQAPTPQSDASFGEAVAIFGTRVVVGAPQQNVSGKTYAGAAHIYDLAAAGPAVFVTTLTKANPSDADLFGAAVAISGSRTVVGVYRDGTGASAAGATYIYDLNGAPPFAPSFILTSPNPTFLDEFGYSVGITGQSRVIVGAYRAGGASESGMAYVFDLDGPTPTIPTILASPTPDADDYFGGNVAISGNRVVVGAPQDDTLATNAGAAYVFGGALGPPEIVVEYPAGTPLTDPGLVNFPVVVAGQTASRPLTIRNTGIGELALTGATLDGTDAGDFTAPLGSLPPALAPGESTTLTVTFAPTSGTGGRAAALHLFSSDADENPFDIALTGSARTRLEAWRLAYFGSSANAGDGADNNDFDFDGLENLLEFATHRDPTAATGGPAGDFSVLFSMVAPGTTRTQVTFTYLRAKAAVLDGIQFRVESTRELTNLWSLVNEPEELVSDDGIEQVVRRTLTIDSPPQVFPDRFFMRLRVSRP